MTVKTLLQTTRGPFLILTPACVLLGISTSVFNSIPLRWDIVSLILIGAVFAHISVNVLNEYLDFKSGLDLKTDKTPFSGGSGALPSNPEASRAVLVLGVVSLLITASIGFYFVSIQGFGIVPIGLLGVLIIVVYTRWINRNPLICLIAPGVGFGFLMVAGADFVLRGQYQIFPWIAASIPFFLVNNLLLLNQYPDIEADKSVGRNHFPIAFGIQASNFAYGLFAASVCSIVLLSVVFGIFPALSLLALLPMIFALIALKGAIQYGAELGRHPQFMAANVAATILTPFVLALTLIFSR